MQNIFRTLVDIKPCKELITHEDHILMLGSCFSDHIGKKLANALFSVDINPFGVLYNPVSILNSVEILLNGKLFGTNDLFHYGSLWNSFSHSSLFSAPDVRQALDNINSRLEYSINNWSKTTYLMVTFGTAWVFEDADSGKVVSNCHKLPSVRFVRRRLEVDEIVSQWSILISKLNALYPALKIVFTVSPVRHWKDGPHDNNLSKSILLLAIDALVKSYSHVHYFPAYEIQMDELRDYRFYADDMLHPSDMAVNYIWEKFSDMFFDKETLAIKKAAEQLSASLAHRPIHQGTIEYEKFMNYLNKQKEEILIQYPVLNGRLSKEQQQSKH